MNNAARYFTSLSTSCGHMLTSALMRLFVGVVPAGLLLAGVVCLVTPIVVGAKEQSVPPHLIAQRDGLAKQKDTYAAQLAAHIRCLHQDENTLREINSHLTTNSLNKKDSSLSKFERTMCLSNHQRNLEILRSSLASVDRELLYVDAQIKHYGAQK